MLVPTVHETNRLAGKTIVIIGGTTGLGLSAAVACAREAARVVIVGRNQESADAAMQQVGRRAARALVADARNPQTATVAIKLAMEEFGGFDGLYHVAGGSGRGQGDGPLHRISDEGWQHTLELNLSTLFYSNRAAAKSFQQQGRPGSILNMGSVLAGSPAPRYFATHAYAAAKAAIVGLTKSSAAYYAPRQIRFNVVAPALVDTPMARRAANDEQILQYIREKQPLDGGRIGQPADLNSAVVFFLSDESKFVTGQVLAVDGGWQLSEGHSS